MSAVLLLLKSRYQVVCYVSNSLLFWFAQSVVREG